MPKRAPLRQKVLKEWGFALTLLLSIPAWLPLLVGFVNTRAGGDSPFLLFRLHQLLLNLRASVLPARWMPDAAYGLGYPFFNFYASLPYYIAALFKLWGFGYIWAIKLTQILGFVTAAGAMYILAKRLFDSKASALLAALAYTYAPFYLVNVYVRGDSLCEFYAFVFYPLIFWALLRLKEAHSAGNLALVAFVYGGLILTHNVSALIFTPFVGLYALLLSLWGSRWKERIIASAGGIGLGWGVSAWFWLPALLEREYVQLEGMTTGYFHYGGHFRGLDLVQTSLLFDYTVDGSLSCFAIGSVQAALALLGTASIIICWIKRRRIKAQEAFLLVSLFMSTFFITPLSRLLWDRLPLLPFVQFPWRFLSIQAFFASLVSGRMVRDLQRSHAVALALGVALMATSMLNLQPEYLPIGEADVTAERLSIYEYFTANIGTTVRNEYLPRWVATRPFTSEVLLDGCKPPPKVLKGTLEEAKLVKLGPTREEWLLDVSPPNASLAFHTYYFPSWRAWVDGKPREVRPIDNLGLIGLDLDQGEHKVLLRLERTPLQALAEGLSLLASLTAIALLLRESNGVFHHLKGLGIALLGIALVAVLLRLMPTTRSDASDLTMDFIRMPYLHHNPQGGRFGEAARLMNYHLSNNEVEAGDTIEVALHWDEVTSDHLTAKVSLVSAVEHLFHVPAHLYTSSAALRSGTTHHRLEVPETAVRGLYLVKVRVWEGESEIEPVTERAEPLGITYLRPVRVHSRIEATGEEPVTAHLGPSIVLSEVETQPRGPEALEVRLTWWADGPVARNHGLSLRLKDAQSHLLSSLDTQPRYGLYPTGMWRAGELIHDRYTLPLQETSVEKARLLEVVLYDPASLEPIGLARIPLGKREPSYTVPPMDTELNANFGGRMRLLGCDLTKTDNELRLKLHWQALQQMEKDYKVFVHLFNPVTEGIAAQHDAMPPIPTSWWEEDEVVSEDVSLDLADAPSGCYRLAVGVYEPKTMKRLRALDADGNPLPASRLVLRREIKVP